MHNNIILAYLSHQIVYACEPSSKCANVGLN